MKTQAELHPELSAEERRRLFWEGIELFNAGRFFDSHESWEEIWRSTTPEPKELFQGLIQVAAGMHHYLDRGRPDPARRVLGKGVRRLEAYRSGGCGLDIEGLLAQVEAWRRWLAIGREPPPRPPHLGIDDASRVR